MIEWVNAFLFLFLIVLLVWEARSYLGFREDAESMSKMYDIFQSTVIEIAGVAEALSKDQLKVKQNQDLTDKELIIVRAILSIHSEALYFKQQDELFKSLDELKKS